MSQTNLYTILSIGPIYDTMQIADNTRAMWTVSFMFSYLMRETIRTLKDKHANDFLVPNVNNDGFKEYLNDGQRVGLFHDRLILKGEHADDVKNAFEEALENLADIVANVFKKTTEENFKYVKVDVKEAEAKTFIKGYFQSYIAEVKIEEDKNPILELSKYVDGVEYEPALPPYEEKEFLFLFFRLTNLGLLQQIAYKEDAYNTLKERCFKSLPEISAWELIKDEKVIEKWKKEHLCLKIDDVENLQNRIKTPDDEAEEIIKELEKEFECKSDGSVDPCFKPYHKYVAIVHGDGDSFGKYLESIGSGEDAIKGFSDSVFAFMTSAREAIGKYGGYPIVGSGEDLLFFAPVINGVENIFSLINQIDRIFKRHFNDPVLSMSYGVSITYYKYPLQEALELSVKALWDEAKEAQWLKRRCYERDPNTKPSREKNAVHIHIQKHSGQSHSLTLPKDTKLYCQFNKLLYQELSPNNTLHLPHALHHSLDRVATVVDATPASRIEHLFVNYFNEDIHKVKHEKALKAVQAILKELKEGDEAIHLRKEGAISQPSKVIFAMLSVIKMLRGDK